MSNIKVFEKRQVLELELQELLSTKTAENPGVSGDNISRAMAESD